MNQSLYERRVQCLKFYSRDIPPSKWTKELSQIHHVNPDTIWRDWNRRDMWLPVIANMKDPEMVMSASVQENIQVKEAAWKLYHNGDNDNARASRL